MTKIEAISLFGETGADLGNALGLSRSRISQWPDVLNQEQVDRVMGAAMRLGITVPIQSSDKDVA